VHSAAPEYGVGLVIVLFGGTFDPVHFGHLRAAWEVKERLMASDFRFLPAGHPPHRSNFVTPAFHRLEMLKLAISGVPGVAIDQRELKREGPSYMVDTLQEIRHDSPDQPVVLVIGQDSANSLDRWHQWQQLFALASLLIMTRPGKKTRYASALAEQMSARRVAGPELLQSRPSGLVAKMTVTALPIASSGIRELIRNGKSPRYLLPVKVLDYLQAHHLYRE